MTVFLSVIPGDTFLHSTLGGIPLFEFGGLVLADTCAFQFNLVDLGSAV